MTNKEDEFHTPLSTFLHSKPSEPAKSISSLKCPMFALEGPLVWDASDLTSNTRWMIGGLLPLETLTFVLRVQTLEGLHDQQNAHVFLCRMTAAEIFKGFSKDSLVLLIIRKPDKLCGRVFLEKRVPIDRLSRRQAPSANAIEIMRFATPVMLITVKMELFTRTVLCETKPATG